MLHSCKTTSFVKKINNQHAYIVCWRSWDYEKFPYPVARNNTSRVDCRWRLMSDTH